MAKIAIVTDSNSGITQAEGKKIGIYVLPMPFMIDEVTYYEDIDLTQEQFYEKLKSGANIATSQPSPDSVTSLWDKLLQEYDEIVHIPMSSGLSGSCQSAMAFAADYDGRVQVVNNQRISVTQRQSALDALQLAAADKDAAQIKEFLENDKFNSHDNKTIASKIGVPPFAAGKYVAQASHFKTSVLKNAVKQCVETEEAVKSGRMNDMMSVEILILSVLPS